MGTKNSQKFMSILLFFPSKSSSKILNEVGLYRNPKILKKGKLPMWDYCKIENCLSDNVGKVIFFFVFDSKCMNFKIIGPKFAIK